MPLSDSTTIASPVAASADGGSSTPPQKHLLIIDDDQAVLMMLEHLLRRRNYVVTAFVNPIKAMEALRNDPASFDLVVTDYNMPEMAGLAVAKTVRGIRADLPVAITSGFIEEQLQTGAKDAGVSGLISKPFTSAELYGIIEQLLDSGSSVPKS